MKKQIKPTPVPSKIRVTKTFHFDMAHALYGHDGPCKNIHGHTYHLAVCLIGSAVHKSGDPKDGMVIDFAEFKSIVNKHVVEVYDHALLLNANSPHAQNNYLKRTSEKVIYFKQQPTCENLLLELVKTVQAHLPSHVSLHSMRLNETPSSYAEWFQSDNT
jgi:6-pyruvoyltetrahydropterin/6-carboxytetrahydropterin synthase